MIDCEIEHKKGFYLSKKEKNIKKVFLMVL